MLEDRDRIPPSLKQEESEWLERWNLQRIQTKSSRRSALLPMI